MAGGSKNGNLAFDQFRLDCDRLMLYRDDVELSLPPKVVKTLAVLVENAGTIVSKDEIIEQVWSDSIVEESNLSQYLYLLRKTLGKMPDGRPYIETLRRRGYRFNGDVERVTEGKPPAQAKALPRLQPEPSHSFGGVERDGNVLRVVDWQAAEDEVDAAAQTVISPEQQTTSSVPPSRSWWRPRLAVAAIGLLLAGGVGALLWPKFMPAATSAESPRELSVIRLTNGYFPYGATISPDGNLFVYHEVDGDISRMFVQQTGQSSRIEIASTSDQVYSSSTFFPDGRSIFFVSAAKKTGLASLYRIPTIGGSAVKILDDINGSVSFSPDGKELVFCRRNATTGDTALVIAGSDGRAERIIIQRKSPNYLLASPAWSPDGKTIAYGDRDSHNGRPVGSNPVNLINVATGRSTQLSAEPWENILRIVWAPDGRGIFMLGTRAGDGYSTRRDQVYFISYPEGVSRRLTNDGNRYEGGSLGVTKNGEVLTVNSNRSCQMWVMNSDGNASSAVQLTRGVADGRAGIGVLPDGRFAYLTRNADEIPIMLANADASNIKQIATGFPFVEELRSDPLGRFFIFSIFEDGHHRLFRIDVDGSNLKQMTFGDGSSIDSSVSPDGKNLAYDSTTDGNDPMSFTVMRMPVEGGQPVLLRKGCFLPTYSPDGSLISCVSTLKAEMVIISAADGAEVERHPVPASATSNFGVGWTADGSGLVYINNDKGVSNLWVQPRDGSKPRALTNFTSGIIYRYAFAPDGSKLYVARGYPIQDVLLIKNFR